MAIFCPFTHLRIPRSPPKFNQFFTLLPKPLHKISSKSIYNFLSNVVHTQTRPIARLFCGRGGGGGKLVKFWDLLWLLVDYLAIVLDLAIFLGGGVQMTPLTPPPTRLRACKQTNKHTDKPTLPKHNLLCQGGKYPVNVTLTYWIIVFSRPVAGGVSGGCQGGHLTPPPTPPPPPSPKMAKYNAIAR